MSTVTREAKPFRIITKAGKIVDFVSALSVREAADLLSRESNRSDFVDGLLKDLMRYGQGMHLDRQKWLIKCGQDLLNRQQAKTSGDPQADPTRLASIVALMRNAGEHQDYPKVRLLTPSGRPVALALCRQGRHEGGVYVSNGKRRPHNVYYGVIHPHEFRIEDREIIETLERFAADPAGVASQYGKLTSSCCFCARTLTDARSLAVGYGPECADKYGLTWGEKTVTEEFKRSRDWAPGQRSAYDDEPESDGEIEYEHY